MGVVMDSVNQYSQDFGTYRGRRGPGLFAPNLIGVLIVAVSSPKSLDLGRSLFYLIKVTSCNVVSVRRAIEDVLRVVAILAKKPATRNQILLFHRYLRADDFAQNTLYDFHFCLTLVIIDRCF